MIDIIKNTIDRFVENYKSVSNDREELNTNTSVYDFLKTITEEPYTQKYYKIYEVLRER